MRIGFIGAGLMGGPLARNLIRANKDLTLYDLSKEAIERTLSVGTSGKAASSMEDLKDCEIIFTSLPMPKHILDVTLGEKGLYSIMGKGTVHVELSTIDPATADIMYNAALEKDIIYLQCTLGKTPAHAEKAEESMFIGGDEATYKKYEELFKLIGMPNYVGSIEASCAVKLIANMISMSSLAVLAEGMAVGEKAGMNLHYLVELLQDTGARSFHMDIRGPWIADGDYENRFGVDLALKDVRLGLEMARNYGLNLQSMEKALENFQKASDKGFAKEDCAAVYKVIMD